MHQRKNNTQKFVRASFNCNKELLDNFRKLVVQKHGHLWGVLCKEFEEALRTHKDRIEHEILSLKAGISPNE